MRLLSHVRLEEAVFSSNVTSPFFGNTSHFLPCFLTGTNVYTDGTRGVLRSPRRFVPIWHAQGGALKRLFNGLGTFPVITFLTLRYWLGVGGIQ